MVLFNKRKNPATTIKCISIQTKTKKPQIKKYGQILEYQSTSISYNWIMIDLSCEIKLYNSKLI